MTFAVKHTGLPNELVLKGVWQLLPDMKKPTARDYVKGVLWVLVLGGADMALGRPRRINL